MSPDQRIAPLARRQHGAFAHAQAVALHVSYAQIRGRRLTGVWIDLESRVYAVASSLATFERSVMGAVLVAPERAAASHATAAWLRGLTQAKPEVIEVSMLSGRGGKRHRYHRSLYLDRRDIGLARNIPTTKVPRTLIDCAAGLDRDDAEAIVDEALLDRLITCESMRRYITARGLKIPGTKVLKEILGDRDSGALNKKLERRFDALMKASTLPYPARQYPWRSYKIDFAYPDLKIAIELDGVRTHAADAALNSDDARQNALSLDAWLILRFTWKRVTRDPDGVLDEIALAIASRAGRGT